MAVKSAPASETERGLATALIALATALFGGTLSAWLAVFPNIGREGGVILFWLVMATLLLLVVSIIMGGRGYVYGPGWTGLRNRFNCQATAGLLAIILIPVIGAVIFFYNEPKNGDALKTRVAALETGLSELSKTVNALSASLDAQQQELAGYSGTVSSLKDVTDDVKKQIDRLIAQEDGR